MYDKYFVDKNARLVVRTGGHVDGVAVVGLAASMRQRSTGIERVGAVIARIDSIRGYIAVSGQVTPVLCTLGRPWIQA